VPERARTLVAVAGETKVIDLMAALRASIDAGSEEDEAAKPRKSAKRAAAAPRKASKRKASG
jgi:non-homologous end joining protein Ku